MALEIKKMKGRKDRNWVIFVGGSDMGTTGDQNYLGEIRQQTKDTKRFYVSLEHCNGNGRLYF